MLIFVYDVAPENKLWRRR